MKSLRGRELALLAALVFVHFTPLISYYVCADKRVDEGEVRFLLVPLRNWTRRDLRATRPAEGALKRRVPLDWLRAAAGACCSAVLGSQFSPLQRNQLLVDIDLPTTDSLTSMRATVDQAVRIIKSHEEVTSAAIFTGWTAPRFYYNVEPKEPANYLAQILVNTRTAHDVMPLLAKLRRELDAGVPGARCVAKELEQGPPVKEPIQIRLSGENLDKLRLLADQVSAELRAAGGYHVHDDLGLRMPNIQIEIDQDRANSLGLNNRRIGEVAQVSFTGLKVTELREGDRLIPVLLRGRIEDRSEAGKLRGLYVQTPDGKSVPFESFAQVKVQRSSSPFHTTTSFAP